MNTFFPYIENGRGHDGIVVPLPQCCKGCLGQKLKSDGNDCSCCERAIARQLGGGIVQVMEAPSSLTLSESDVNTLFLIDAALIVIRDFVPELMKQSEAYDEVLLSLYRRIVKIARKTDYTKRHGTLVVIKKDDIDRLNRDLDELNEISECCNAIVTDVDIWNIQIPFALSAFMDDLEKRGFPIRKGLRVFSQTDLGKISALMASSELGLYGIPLKTAPAIWRLCVEYKKANESGDSFSQLIHDANHYMCRLRKFLELTYNNQFEVDTIHSIDALIGALCSLKVEFNELCGKASGLDQEWQTRKSYRPYRLFHKFRYCYWGEGIKWIPGGEEFDREAYYARGIESAVLNIYSNAVKYLVKYQGERKVTTSFCQKGDYVEITVSSMGPVVKDEEKMRLTEDGYRAESVREVYPGNGRGLFRIKKVCDEAGYAFAVDQLEPVDNSSFALFVVRICIPNGCFLS